MKANLLSDIIQATIETLTELKRMYQLNYELLEQLNVACQWILDNQIHISNEEQIRSLLSKAVILLNELRADEPRIIQYQKLPNENLQHRKPNKEFTERASAMLINTLIMIRGCYFLGK
jgi:hypothetical protein